MVSCCRIAARPEVPLQKCSGTFLLEIHMFVYQPGTRGKRVTLAQPGAEYPVSHFLDADGKPIMFSVTFTEGRAEVSNEVGQYLIDKGVAKSSPIILFN